MTSKKDDSHTPQKGISHMIYSLRSLEKFIQGLIIYGYTRRIPPCTLCCPSPHRSHTISFLGMWVHNIQRSTPSSPLGTLALLIWTSLIGGMVLFHTQSGTVSHSPTGEVHPLITLSFESQIESQHCLSAVTLSEGSSSRDLYRASYKKPPQLLCLAATSPDHLGLLAHSNHLLLYI